jgi:predicted nucleic-acid-binding Zn-ribbon protein
MFPMSERHDRSISFARTCIKCGSRSERVTTIAESTENAAYQIYQCLECKYVEWLLRDQ